MSGRGELKPTNSRAFLKIISLFCNWESSCKCRFSISFRLMSHSDSLMIHYACGFQKIMNQKLCGKCGNKTTTNLYLFSRHTPMKVVPQHLKFLHNISCALQDLMRCQVILFFYLPLNFLDTAPRQYKPGIHF